MLDQQTRTSILELKKRGLSNRQIARALKIARESVKAVLDAGRAEVPRLERPEKAEPFRDRIIEELARCKGNLVRVHEELVGEGCDISYSTLTAFCRRNEIGRKPKTFAGEYHFRPGEEMQHDTSPHEIQIGGRRRKAQVASVVLCYSRLLFFQYFPRFTRFDCKVFLTDALRYIGGSCQWWMIDNTHVVVLRGTGPDMVPVPEMEAFADHFGATFRAHAVGDANRSGRVERPFSFIEKNFEAGRSGRDWDDWNRQAMEWCDKVNAATKRHLKASPRELFAAERPHLKPLPHWIPDVYQLHQRTVGVEGYVRINGNHYSVPTTMPIGRVVEVREYKDRIEICDGPRIVATHARVPEPCNKRVTNPAHRPPRGEGKKAREGREEALIRSLAPELASYVSDLKKHGRGIVTIALRRLLSMLREYPRAPLIAAIQEAHRYGLFDLDRVERMVLKRIGDDFYFLPPTGPELDK